MNNQQAERAGNVVGKNHGDVAIENKSSIIKYLRRSGVCSRAQIAQAVGLTQASISKIIAQLKSEGIVFETGFIAGAKGRRSVGVALNTMCKRVLGVRLSRRSFAVGLFDLSGKMYENVSGQFSATTTLRSVIIRIKEILRDFLARYEDIAAIGVAVPGPFNVKTAEIALTTSMATSDWTNVRLREEFGEDLPVKVVFCHDAIAGALANWWFGSKVDKFRSSLVHFLVGDGVGAGFIENGEVHENAMGFSTEMGHVSVDVDGPLCACGNRGCLELYCSTFAFLDDVNQRLARPEGAGSVLARLSGVTVQDVFTAAAAGDPLAMEAVDRVGRYIGYGVVNLINIYAPDVVVVSNEMAKGGRQILDRVREVVRERVLPATAESVAVELEDEWLLGDPVLFGAGAVAINYCLEDPMILLGSGMA
ncbi:MAG: ROK family transcriptional regulator [Acutalibacter sp.]|nr:ROK family transcriptional regulator [Acutalibacter sp.]